MRSWGPSSEYQCSGLWRADEPTDRDDHWGGGIKQGSPL